MNHSECECDDMVIWSGQVVLMIERRKRWSGNGRHVTKSKSLIIFDLSSGVMVWCGLYVRSLLTRWEQKRDATLFPRSSLPDSEERFSTEWECVVIYV